MKFLNLILDALKEIYNQLIYLKIPDFVLLLLLVLFLVWLLIVNKKLKRRLRTDIENIRSEIGRIPEEFKQEKIVEIEEKVEEKVEVEAEKRIAEKEEAKAPLEIEEEKHEIEKSEWHEDKKELDEKIDLNDKQIFILLSISNEPAKTYEQEKLFDIYKMAFAGSGRPEFNTMIEALKGHNLIKPGESSTYKDWLEITEKGLQYLEKKRKE